MKTRPPKDINQLTKAQLVALLSAQEQENQQQKKRITSLSKLVEELAEQLRLKRHQQYGASSEKTDPNQQPELFDEAEEAFIESTDGEVAQGLEGAEAVDTDADTTNVDAPRKPTRGRKALPSNLERRRVELDVTDAEKLCACGCQKVKIGEALSEKLTSYRRRCMLNKPLASNTPAPNAKANLLLPIQNPRCCQNPMPA